MKVMTRDFSHSIVRSVIDDPIAYRTTVTNAYNNLAMRSSRATDIFALIGTLGFSQLCANGIRPEIASISMRSIIRHGAANLANDQNNWHFSGDEECIRDFKSKLFVENEHIRDANVREILEINERHSARYLVCDSRGAVESSSAFNSIFDNSDYACGIVLDAFALARIIRKKVPGTFFIATQHNI